MAAHSGKPSTGEPEAGRFPGVQQDQPGLQKRDPVLNPNNQPISLPTCGVIVSGLSVPSNGPFIPGYIILSPSGSLLLPLLPIQ